MTYLSVSQAKYNKMEKELRAGIIALEQENERLKALLSEDLVAENAKLKLKIWEMECAMPKTKADAIREAKRQIIDAWCNSCDHVSVVADDRYVYVSNRSLDEYADQLEQVK